MQLDWTMAEKPDKANQAAANGIQISTADSPDGQCIQQDNSQDENIEDDELPTMISPISLTAKEMASSNEREAREHSILEYDRILPTFGIPFSKVEERELKRVRRRIKNKISAQESRRRKKEYIDNLEKGAKQKETENAELRRSMEMMESKMRLLVDELFRVKQEGIVDRTRTLPNASIKQTKLVTRATQTGMCLQCYLQQNSSLSIYPGATSGLHRYHTDDFHHVNSISGEAGVNCPSLNHSLMVNHCNGDEISSKGDCLSINVHADHDFHHCSSPVSSSSVCTSTVDPSHYLTENSSDNPRTDRHLHIGKRKGRARTKLVSERKSQSNDIPNVVYRSENVILIKDPPDFSKRRKSEVGDNDAVFVDQPSGSSCFKNAHRNSLPANHSVHKILDNDHKNGDLTTHSCKNNSVIKSSISYSEHNWKDQVNSRSYIHDGATHPYIPRTRIKSAVADFQPTLTRSQSEAPIPSSIWNSFNMAAKERKNSHENGLEDSTQKEENDARTGNVAQYLGRKRCFSDSDDLARKINSSLLHKSLVNQKTILSDEESIFSLTDRTPITMSNTARSLNEKELFVLTASPREIQHTSKSNNLTVNETFGNSASLGKHHVSVISSCSDNKTKYGRDLTQNIETPSSVRTDV